VVESPPCRGDGGQAGVLEFVFVEQHGDAPRSGSSGVGGQLGGGLGCMIFAPGMTMVLLHRGLCCCALCRFGEVHYGGVWSIYGYVFQIRDCGSGGAHLYETVQNGWEARQRDDREVMQTRAVSA